MVKTFYPGHGQPAITKGTCKQSMIQHVLVHRQYTVDNKGNERLVLEWRMTRK